VPLTEKGEKILANMKSQYGEKRGTEVFYASKNAGKISGVDTDDAVGKRVGIGDDNQHMGFTSGLAQPITKLITECDGLAARIDAFERRRAMKKPEKVKPRTKDGMQPSMPHPKEPGG
jgi:hypothetical protein